MMKKLTAYFLFLILPLFFSSCASSQLKDMQAYMEKRNFAHYLAIQNFQKSKPQEVFYESDGVRVIAKNGKDQGRRNMIGEAELDFTNLDQIEIPIPLTQFDLSQAIGVTLLSKSKTIDPNAIQLKIQDDYKEVVLISQSIEEIGDNWKRIYYIFPDDFKRDHLLSFQVSLQQSGSFKNTWYFDDILAVGDKYFFDSSSEDNYLFFEYTPDTPSAEELLKMEDLPLLQAISKATWEFIFASVNQKTGFPVDRIEAFGKKRVNNFTTPTNIGLYLASVIAAKDLGYIDEREETYLISRILQGLAKMETWGGFYFNFYDTTTLERKDQFISSVDNGWLGIGLLATRELATLQENSKLAGQLLSKMDFSHLYDEEIGHLYLGYNAENLSYTDYHYGFLCSEARAASFLGIGMGDLPYDHWFRMNRVLDPEHDWQNQIPQGSYKFQMGIKVFEGHYLYNKTPIVPSWGGSAFEFLMPELFIDEAKYAPKGLGLNNLRAIDAHIQFSKEKGFFAWGQSPCANPNIPRSYDEYGVPPIAVKGYSSEGVISPYASILGVELKPQEVVLNMRNMLRKIPGVWTPYGFYDAFTAESKKIAHTYLVLDQEMIFLAISNYLLGEKNIKTRLHTSPEWQKAKRVLQIENFY